MMEHAITEEDIRDFYDLYNEFISLERDYQHMILGRKEVSQELVKKLELLERMSRLIERNKNSKISLWKLYERCKQC